MLKVTNGVLTLEVTNGAYNTYFKGRGFSVVDATETNDLKGLGNTQPTPEYHEEGGNNLEKTTPTRAEQEVNPADEGEDPESLEYLKEIPLSEMSFDTLCDYADYLGLNRNGIRSKKELRQLIREHLKK